MIAPLVYPPPPPPTDACTTLKDKEKKENKLIIGENYDALKNLLLTHQGKIDVIYIDPPYNTEVSKIEGNYLSTEKVKEIQDKLQSERRKFIYRDKFARTGWLNMMFERLKLAQKLLSEEGIIFVSVDDSEQAYLKVLMDEVFDENNFLNQINWISNKKGRQISINPYAKTYEYILVYENSQSKKNFDENKFNREFLQSKMPEMYVSSKHKLYSDSLTSYNLLNQLYNTNIKKFNKLTRKNLYFPIFCDYKKGIISTIKFKNSEVVFPPKTPSGQSIWRWSKNKVQKDQNNLQLVKNKKGKIEIWTKKRDFNYKLKDTILGSSFTTKSASSELKTIGLFFPYPKPTSLIKLLIKSVATKNSIILDFFAGSGTTGHAVLDLNQEDGGNRQFILVTNNENGIAKNICYERLYRIIKGKNTNGKKNFTWVEKNKLFIDSKLRVFDLEYKNVPIGTNIDDLGIKTLSEFKKLSSDFESDKNDIYFKLASLVQNTK